MQAHIKPLIVYLKLFGKVEINHNIAKLKSSTDRILEICFLYSNRGIGEVKLSWKFSRKRNNQLTGSNYKMLSGKVPHITHGA